MKNILILGSEGYLGSVLVPHLYKSNFKITGVDECFFGINNSRKHLKIVKKDYSKLSEIFLSKFDIVVDLVNISNDPASELDKNFTKKVNFINKKLLIKKIKKSPNLKKYIYMSSCSVYGHNKFLINERSKPKPISLYSKLCLKFENYIKKNLKYKYSILRLGTLYGWSSRMRYDIAINKIIRDMIFNNKIEILGGQQLRFFCYNKFACNFIEKILRSKNSYLNNRVINVGVHNTNIINLTKQILNITKFKKASLFHEKFNIDNRSYAVSLRSVKKLYKEINFKNYFRNSIKETFKSINKDKTPFDKKKVTLNIYKDYLQK